MTEGNDDTARSDHLCVLYASQTGNAEWIAKNIDKEAKLRGYQSECLVMEHAFEKVPKLFEERVLVFVSSTTGDGDPPDNAVKFWRHLRTALKSIDTDKPFSNTLFTVCGIGDTNYSNFGAHPRKIEKKMVELGASLFHPKVIADEVEGLENAIDPWIAGLWPQLAKVCRPIGPDLSGSVDDATEQRLGSKMADQQQSAAPGKTMAETVLAEVAQITQQLKADAIISSLPPPPPPPISSIAHSIPLPPLPANVDQLSGLPKLPAAIYRIVIGEGEQGCSRKTVAEMYNDIAGAAAVDQRHPCLARVTGGRCLTAVDAVKRTLELEVDLGENAADWQLRPGDSIGVLCQNSDELVGSLLGQLSLSGDPAIKVTLISESVGDSVGENHFASVKTAAELFKFFVDISSPPRKSFFRLLAEHCRQLDEKRMLLYLCSREGSAALKQLLEYTPTIADLLATFPHSRPPVERLLDCLGLLHPRHYSICNSPLEIGDPKKKNQIARIAFNVVEYPYPEPINGQRVGVCTGWLYGALNSRNRLTANRPVKIDDDTRIALEPLADLQLLLPIFPNRTKDFLLPEDPRVPVIMIGPGTGVAPFVGMARHRQLSQRDQQRQNWGQIWLFYGCRDRQKDFLFRRELRHLEADGTLTRLIVCYSRENTGENEPRYVQDSLRVHGAEIMELMAKQGAKLFVCGDAKGMAKAVNDALLQIIVDYYEPKVANASEAMRLIGQWTADKRYVRDVWQ